MDFWHEFFESTLGANKDWSRWSDIGVVMLPEMTSWEIIVENILSMKVCIWCSLYIIFAVCIWWNNQILPKWPV